jgi:hypothetical protein
MASKSMYKNIWENFDLVMQMMIRWDPRQTLSAFYQNNNEVRVGCVLV